MKQKILSILMIVIILMTSVDVTAFAQELRDNTTDISVISEQELEETSSEETESIDENVDEVSVECESENDKNVEDDTEITEENKDTGEEENVEQVESDKVEELEFIENQESVSGNETLSSNSINVSTASGEISGQCGTNLTWSIVGDTLTISGSGSMHPYSYGSGTNFVTDAPWGQYADELKVLIIEEGITSIGGCAFYGCDGFTGSLVLPESLYYIESEAFGNCSGFTGDLKIPEKVTSIGRGVFSGCSGFTGNLTLPEGIVTIDTAAFSGCSGFVGDLVIPDKVTQIGARAFENCSGFTGNLELPENITSIEERVFSGCSGFIGSLEIPEKVEKIGREAFKNCSGFTGNLIIPDQVTVIGESAFWGCNGFNGNLILPLNIKEVGNYAFLLCSGLEGNLILPEGLTTIGYNAFERCSGFTGSLEIPGSVETIGNSAFKGCTSFDGELTLQEGITYIEGSAFSGCTGFKGNLIIPKSVTMMESHVFYMCTGFDGNLIISEGIEVIPSGVFSGCTGFTGDLVIGDSVTSIGNSAFSGCTGFTGDLVIGDSVTEIGGSAFSGCTGFTGDLVIGDSVTEIGDSAFSGCSGFSGNLEIPSSVKTIEDSAFLNCRGFDGSLIMKEPLGNAESSMTIGDSAFSGCSGLTGTLNIREDVTSIGYQAFYQCSGLNGNVYVPPSVIDIGTNAFDLGITQSTRNAGAISSYVNFYVEPESYAESYAINYGYPYHPYYYGVYSNFTAMENGEYIHVYIIDAETKLGIENAEVNGKVAANTNGYVMFLLSEADENGKIVFRVSAEGYFDEEIEKTVCKKGIYRLEIDPKEGDFKIISAVAKIGTEKTDLLSDKLRLTHTDNISSSEQSMEIEVGVRGEAVNYELLQGSEVIQSSTDGKFTIPIIEQSGKFPLIGLDALEKLTVKATDASGETATEKIGISIWAEGWSLEEEDLSFEMGTENLISVAEDVPFLGGKNLSFGFLEELPVEVEVSETGDKLCVAVNKESDIDMSEFKGEYDRLSAKAARGSEKADFGGKPQSFGAGYKDITVSLIGYGEVVCNLQEDKTYTHKIDVGIILKAEAEAGYTQYFYIASIPVYITVTGNIGGEGNVHLCWGTGGGVIPLEYGMGTIHMQIGLTVEGGVGIDNFLSVGAAGTAECHWRRIPPTGVEAVWSDELWLEGFWDIHADVLAWTLPVVESKKLKYNIYPKETVSPQTLSTVDIEEQIYDTASYKIMDRTYMKRAQTSLLTEHAESRFIQTYVYPGASPKLVEVGSRFYMFWLQDIASRTAENRAALVYAVSEDGATWSAPKQIVGETGNQTLDGSFDIYVEDGKIYVCWQDMAESLPSGTGLNEALQKINIAYAIIDSSAGTVIEEKIITSEPGCYIQPKVCAENGAVTVVWVKSEIPEDGSLLNSVNQNSLIIYEALTGETISIDLGSQRVMSIDLATEGGQLGVFYSLDEDGNLQTTEDRKVYYDTRNGKGQGSQTVLNESGNCGNIVVTEGTCYWYADQNIYYVSVGETAIKSVYAEAGEGIPCDFEVVSDGNNTTILWNAINQETDCVSLYGIRNMGDSWTQPFVIEHTDSYMTGIVSGAYKNGELFVSYLHVQDLEDGSKCHSICVTKEKVINDISLQFVSYDNENLVPGAPLPMIARVTNKGNRKVEQIQILWDGSILETQKVQLEIGETKDIEIQSYNVSEGIVGYEEHVVTVQTADEQELSDNSDKVGIGYTDLEVICNQRLEDGRTKIDVSVMNNSYIPTNCVLNLRANEKKGEILYSKDLGEIKGQKGVAITLDLRKYEEYCCTYFVEAVPDKEDNIEGNNRELVFNGYGTDIPAGNLSSPPVYYTVSFQSNGGEDIESQQVEEDEKAQVPMSPSKEGYHFDGWYLNGEEYDFSTPVKSNIILEAKWREYETLISPFANIDSGSGVEAGTKLVLTCGAASAAIYYTTDGSEPTINSNLYQKPIVIMEDITIKAFAVLEGYKDSAVETFTYQLIEQSEFTVVFDSNGGSEVESQSVAKNQKAIEPGNPVKEGYQFDGWYLNGELYDFDNLVTMNICLEAKWKELDRIASPQANIPTGSSVRKGTEVELFSTIAGTKIYYTTDGTLPTSNSILYRQPILIKGDTEIRAIAVKEQYRNSEVAVFRYTISPAGDVLEEDIPAGGIEAIPDGLWIAGLSEEGYPYTGKAIKPEVRVYDGTTLLKEKIEYNVSYKNNINANDGSNTKKAPTITITGKGNYEGKVVKTFVIQPKSMEHSDISVDNLLAKYNGRVQKPTPVVMENGKKLRNKTHYTLEYPDLTEESTDAYKAAGEYRVLIRGKGNYSGTKVVKFTITNLELISKVSVSSIRNQNYTGVEIKPAVVVKYKGSILAEGTDYTLSYENNTEVGTATVVINGMGDYIGEKRVNFKIVGIAINKAKVTGIPKTISYTGNPITTEAEEWGDAPILTITVNQETKTLTEGVDYTVSYLKNEDKGSASIIFTGINGYSGSLKKNFSIKAYDIGKDINEQIKVYLTNEEIYQKGGSRPKPLVMYENIILEEGKDYTLTYSNHTAANDGNNPKKIPTVTIKGKGNFTGNRQKNFIIKKEEISHMLIAVSDKVYQNKKNAYKMTPVITEIGGKSLKAGTDYEKNYVYSYKYDSILADGTKRLARDLVESEDIPVPGTTLTVTVTGKGNYTGTLSGEYRIVKYDIAKAKVSIPAQIYTGEEIMPDMDEIKVTYGKNILNAEDYEIIGYANNVKKGTAQVILKGIGEYGGYKKVNFSIRGKNLFWQN